ncbi:MAG: hypothetical protein KDD58_01260 [Bdellovibrionales bacterium]|nr:hypothetical protein [Bdellovibrionales bacterium]
MLRFVLSFLLFVIPLTALASEWDKVICKSQVEDHEPVLLKKTIPDKENDDVAGALIFTGDFEGEGHIFITFLPYKPGLAAVMTSFNFQGVNALNSAVMDIEGDYGIATGDTRVFCEVIDSE